MSEFILYSYFRSSAAYRARIAMNLKGLAYEYRAIHIVNNGGEQNTEEYFKINPSRQVPVLVHEGKTIAQSMAIIDYLDHVKPEPRFFPEDAYKRALVIQACEIVNSGIQPFHNLKLLQELESQFGIDQMRRDKWSSFWITRGLDALEAFLAPHAGDFCFGHTVSAADCFLAPHFANAKRFKVALEPYPHLLRVAKNYQLLDAFKRAAPEVQPDTPK